MIGSIVAAVLCLVVGAAGVAAAQPATSVFVPYAGAPLESAAAPAPAAPPPARRVAAMPGVPPEWGLLRLDVLPPGALIAVNGRPLGAADTTSATWIALPPGPHVLDLALPGGPGLRLTVVVPVERSGYQVVPKP